MNFQEYLKIYNAQSKINKLAKRYKNKKIAVYGAGQFSISDRVLILCLNTRSLKTGCGLKIHSYSGWDFANCKINSPFLSNVAVA
jgi:hypothetical protein